MKCEIKERRSDKRGLKILYFNGFIVFERSKNIGKHHFLYQKKISLFYLGNSYGVESQKSNNEAKNIESPFESGFGKPIFPSKLKVDLKEFFFIISLTLNKSCT